MPDFVSLLLGYTKEYESPTSFWKWSSYAAVAAVLRNNVYFKHKLGEVYPNVYVLFLADSAAYRKGGPFGLVEDLLAEVANTKIFSGSASIQGIIEGLSQSKPIKHKGVTVKGGGCIIIAEELRAFFVEDNRLLSLLTRMYDFKKSFDYILRGGSITINSLCVNLLAASNEEFLREIYNDRAIYGGLLRRTLLILPDEKRNPNSLMKLDDRQVLGGQEKKHLADELHKISQLTGEIEADKEAAVLYDLWYKDLYSKYDKYGGRAGVLEGMHTLALKLAMIIAASQQTLKITHDTMQRAILEVTALRPNYERYVMGIGKSDLSKVGALILNYLYKSTGHEMTRRDILLKVWNDISAEELDTLVVTLEQTGLIKTKALQNDISYQLTEKCLQIFKAEHK